MVYLPRALALVWAAAPGWVAVWAVLLAAQGLLPAAAVYVSRSLVNRLAAAVGSGPDWNELRLVAVPASLLAGILLLAEILRCAAEWVRAAQAELLKDIIEVSAIIYLRAEKAKMVERLRRRALKENRFDDASDVVINKRMDVFEKETRPVLDMYPKNLVTRIDATLSQIRVLGEIVKVLTPLKESMDHENEGPLGHA